MSDYAKDLIRALLIGGLLGCLVWVAFKHETIRQAFKPLPTTLFINKTEPTKPKARVKKVKPEVIDQIIETLCQIESGGNPKAVGDNGRAVGILQLWPIMVREANRIAGKVLWDVADRWCPAKSRAMARTVLRHYQRHHKIEDPVQLAGLWNRPDGKAPQSYLDKFEKAWKNQ